MDGISERDAAAMLDLLARVGEAEDGASFGARLVEAVRALVPGTHISFNEVDLRSGDGAVVFDPPKAWGEDLLTAFLAHAGEHPLIRLHEVTGISEPHVLSEVASPRELGRTGLQAEVFAPLDVRDQLAFAVATGPGRVVGLAISRDRRGFTEREERIVKTLNRPLVRAYLGMLERRRARALRASLADGLDAAGRAGVLVDRRGRIEWRSPLAARLLERHALPAARLPPELLEAAGPTPLATTDGATLAVRGPARPVDGRSWMLELGEDDPARDAARVRALGLTGRQAEVLMLCAQGLGNSGIAARLGVSRRTVDRHLEDAYRRLGVSSRSAATRAVLNVLDGDGALATARGRDPG